MTKNWEYSHNGMMDPPTVEADGRRIAEVYSSDADARLIATAPEMLAQLKYVSVCMRMWLKERATEVCDETDRLIAKAEGKE